MLNINNLTIPQVFPILAVTYLYVFLHHGPYFSNSSIKVCSPLEILLVKYETHNSACANTQSIIQSFDLTTKNLQNVGHMESVNSKKVKDIHIKICQTNKFIILCQG